MLIALTYCGPSSSEQHRFSDAERAFETARSLDRHASDADFNLGRLAVVRGDLTTAAARFERALRIQPDDFRANYQLGLIYRQRGEFALLRNVSWKPPSSAPGV